MAYAAAHADHHNSMGFFRRWLFSTNHKDIGTLYLTEAILAGVIGGGLSAVMRAELAEPGVQIFHNAHMYNAFATALVLILTSMFVPDTSEGTGFAGGWTIYPPLSSKAGAPGPAMDLAIFA